MRRLCDVTGVVETLIGKDVDRETCVYWNDREILIYWLSHRENALSNKISTFAKSINMNIWVAGTLINYL